MKSLPDLDKVPAVRGVVIAEVSQLLGVPMPTLRAWELRYGIPSSQRPKGRHRRYSPAELHALRLMRDEISRGRRAAVAARVVRDLLDPPEPQATLIRRFLLAAEQLDGSGVQVVLSDAAAVLGLANCVDQVLLPALRQVGNWWAAMAEHHPAAVVLVSQLASGRRHTIGCLSAVQCPEVELFYAGNAFTGAERQLPGTFLGTDIGKASRIIINTVNGPRGRTAGRRPAAPPSRQAGTG